MSEVVNVRPNLFRRATKELSQDAVICWLIDWAGFPQSENADDEKLRRCGRAFLDALFAKWKDWPVELGPDIRTEVCQQEQGIDVLARVDGRYVLLIEDKTGTRPHDEQLKRYMPSWVGNIHQRGGFYGLWGRPSSAAPETWLEFGHYGGAEQRHQLAFKLEVPDASLRKERREWWRGALMAAGRGSVTRPRLGLGKTMTVGLWEPFLAFDEEDGRLDVSGTVRQIQEAERVLEEVSRNVSQRRNGTWAE